LAVTAQRFSSIDLDDVEIKKHICFGGEDRDLKIFNQVYPVYGVVVTWSNEIDVAPAAIYAKIKKNAYNHSIANNFRSIVLRS
jgi:hypothetical protein